MLYELPELRDWDRLAGTDPSPALAHVRTDHEATEDTVTVILGSR